MLAILRKLLLTLHLWAGLTAGIFLILLSVTGSLMVFEEEIDRALNPKLTWIKPSEKPLSLTEMKARLEKNLCRARPLPTLVVNATRNLRS
jgi:uncharacterized iron-regulated membrane protein